jgi:hypothetical protein
MARIKYFKPWDWVIGVSVPEAELYEAGAAVDQVSHSGTAIMLALGLAILVGSCVTWYLVANGLMRRTDRIIRDLNYASDQVSSAAAQVSTTRPRKPRSRRPPINR